MRASQRGSQQGRQRHWPSPPASRGRPEPGILFELNRFAAAEVHTEEERWLKFFTEGERLDPERLPDWMQTTEMRRAMSTLQAFSEKERAYDAYRARQHALHLQATIQQRQLELETAYAAQGAELEAERQAKEAAIRAQEAERQAKETEQQAKEAALTEIARLKALLQDPKGRTGGPASG